MATLSALSRSTLMTPILEETYRSCPVPRLSFAPKGCVGCMVFPVKNSLVYPQNIPQNVPVLLHDGKHGWIRVDTMDTRIHAFLRKERTKERMVENTHASTRLRRYIFKHMRRTKKHTGVISEGKQSVDTSTRVHARPCMDTPTVSDTRVRACPRVDTIIF
jgi:hypothetical protein